MNDLISRAALLKECERRQETDPMEDGRGWADHFLNNAQNPSTEWECVEAMIENMPVVDAASVVHGRWKAVKAGCSNNYPFWDSKCSVCGYTTAMTQTGWLYCPHCGARMDETEG